MNKQYSKCAFCCDGFVKGDLPQTVKECDKCLGKGCNLDGLVKKEDVLEIHSDLSVDLGEIYVEIGRAHV